MRLRGNSIVFMVLILLGLATFISAARMQFFQSKFLPLLVSGTITVLASAGLWRDLAVRRAEADGAGETEDGRWRPILLNGVWLLAFAAGLFLLGFLVAVPVFVLLYMHWLGTKWRVAALCAILTPLVLYLVFEVAVEAELYRGLLSAWLGL